MDPFLLAEVVGGVGMLTLNRPQALNALSLAMVRGLNAWLSAWQRDPAVHAVALRGSNKQGYFGHFCAGGDIRYFHQVALAGDPALEDFFTEEYALNHLIHHFDKPLITFLDGVVMGGGMGLCQGASHRLVTARTKMAMPETIIGLFPDVGGGYFLARCPGSSGEWLALTGETVGPQAAIALGLADRMIEADVLAPSWDALGQMDWSGEDPLPAWLEQFVPQVSPGADAGLETALINQHFSHASVVDIVRSLGADRSPWAQHTADLLRKRSPLLLHVALEHVRRARVMNLADDLRMERDMIRHCFHPHHLGRSGAETDTVEGIRALVIDKDQQPRWNPPRIEDVTPDMVAPFFESPWPAAAHPLRHLR